MIGLEFLINIYGFKNKDVADKLNISAVTVHDWIKGKRRIPVARIEQLSQIFNIPVEFFQKQLTEEDKIEIQKLKVRNETKNNRGESNIVNENYDTMTEDALVSLMLKEQEEQIKRLDKALKFLENKSVLLDVIGGIRTYQYYPDFSYSYKPNSRDEILLDLENDDEEVNSITIKMDDISSIEFDDNLDEDGELYDGESEYYCENVWINLYNGQTLRIEYQW